MSASPRLIDRLASPHDDMLRVLVHEAAIGIVIIDRDGRIVRVNKALRRMVGPACDLSPGASALGIFSRSRRDETWEELGPVLLGARPPRTFVSMVSGKDGHTEYTVDISAVALHEADGLVSGLILHLSDASVQARLEAQLAHGQKLQALGQFTSGIAHDFNNLLMAMIGAADEVLARGPCAADTQADLDQIRTSGQRGASLVRQLLAFGRQQPLQLKMLSVNEAVSALAHLLLRLVGRTIKLELDLDGGEADLTLWVDASALDQILVNLVVNARDAMPAGGTVKLKTGHVSLDDSWVWEGDAMAPGRYVIIDVSDTGVGISPEILPQIFDPFFTTRGDQGGSGLGLSTVHAIVRRFHGFLTVQSQRNSGTTFRIYLPRQDRITAIATCSPASPPSSGIAAKPATTMRGTLLLVDDEDGVRRLTARALMSRGWDVVAAGSAEAALQLLQDDPDLALRLCIVVTDVALPGLSGPDLVHAMRTLRPGLPALLASGYGAETVLADLRNDDIGFLSKPFEFAELASAVERLAWRAPQPAVLAPGTLAPQQPQHRSWSVRENKTGANS